MYQKEINTYHLLNILLINTITMITFLSQIVTSLLK